MPSPEHGPSDPSFRRESPAPLALPPELAEYLKDKQYACLTHATDQGTAYVIKAPSPDIQSVRGTVPVRVAHELYALPTAPVVRTTLHLYDRPQRPLGLESYINVEDPQQRDDYAALAEQPNLLLLFYNEALAHALSKQVGNTHQDTIRRIVDQATDLVARIPRGRFNFEAAKAAVMRSTSL